jgi:hypothetical protein
MRRQGELSAKERRRFEGLVRAFHELDAYDPHAPDQAIALPAPTSARRSDRLRSRWRRWRLR